MRDGLCKVYFVSQPTTSVFQVGDQLPFAHKGESYCCPLLLLTDIISNCGSNSRVVLASHPTITDAVFSLRLVNQRLVNVPAFSPGRKLVESPYIRMMIRNAFLSSPAMTLARRRKAVETSGTIVIVLLHQISLLNCLVW